MYFNKVKLNNLVQKFGILMKTGVFGVLKEVA